MSERKMATEFTVVRSRWGRGSHINSMLLHRATGRMCCMGFYARACGYTENEIAGVQTLHGLGDFGSWLSRSVVNPGEQLGDEMNVYLLNDRSTITDEQRERDITLALAAAGITVHFVDDDQLGATS